MIDKVTGHLLALDKTRLVFLGQNPDEPDLFYLGFRNHGGDDTKLKLSREALGALIKLYLTPFNKLRTTFPHKVKWLCVREGELVIEKET